MDRLRCKKEFVDRYLMFISEGGREWASQRIMWRNSRENDHGLKLCRRNHCFDARRGTTMVKRGIKCDD